MCEEKKAEKTPAQILSEARSALRKTEEQKYAKLIAAFMQSHSDDFLAAATRGQPFINVEWKEFSAAFNGLSLDMSESFYRLRSAFAEMGCEIQRQPGANGAVMLFFAEM